MNGLFGWIVRCYRLILLSLVMVCLRWFFLFIEILLLVISVFYLEVVRLSVLWLVISLLVSIFLLCILKFRLCSKVLM